MRATPKHPCTLCDRYTRRTIGGVSLCSECRVEDLVVHLVMALAGDADGCDLCERPYPSRWACICQECIDAGRAAS